MPSERLSEHLEPSGAQRRDTIEQQNALMAVISRLRQSLELTTIFQTTATGIRQLLQADRVGVFRFDPDAHWEGEFVAEDVADGFDSAIAIKVYDHCFSPNFSEAYAQGRVQAVTDIYMAGLSDCHIEILAKFQVRANLAVPLLKGKQLWGLLCIHQCSGPRHWQLTEIEFIQVIAEHLIVALQQAELLAQTQRQAAELTETLQTLRKTQTQLIQGEKMASLGQLVAGIAHEINNPVNFIFGNITPVNEYANDLLKLVQFYRQQYPETELESSLEPIDVDFILNDFPKVMESMRVGAQRIREIVLSLRNFSRSDESGAKTVNLHEGIDSTLLILGHRFRKSGDRPEIFLVKDYGNLPQINCYPAQINQVFMNILANSLDALEEKYASMPQSVLRIEIKTEMQGNDVTIQVQDNALGVPEAVCDRIFDPFFTTKAPGKGTGLGLSISYQIITELHGGTLECKSYPKEGTTFVITLPTMLAS
jgi:signal transduction histidine kinase